MKILSIGYSRQLFTQDKSAGDVQERLLSYASKVDKYVLIIHSLKKHGISGKSELAKGLTAYASNGFNRFDSFLKMLFLGTKLLKSETFDLIQAQDPLFTGSLAYLLARRFNIPYNVCIYGTNPFDKNFYRLSSLNWILAPLMRYIIRQADGIQLDGKNVMRSLIDHGINSTKLYYKPMVPQNLSNFLETEVSQKVDSSPWKFLFIGRLAKQKNLNMLLEAMKILKQEDVSFQLNIVGEGPLKVKTQHLINSLNLNDCINIAGKIPHEDLPSWLSKSDVLLMTSYYEGFPRVFMEAAAVGIPIISTDVSGANDIIEHGVTGMITPIDQHKTFAQSVVDYIKTLDILKYKEVTAKLKDKILTFQLQYQDTNLQIKIWESILKGKKV